MELNVPTDNTLRTPDQQAAFHDIVSMVEESQARRAQAIVDVERFFSQAEQDFATVEESQSRGERFQREEEQARH